MDIRVETLPNYRLAYVRQIGPYGPANVQAMEKLKSWAMGKGLLTESAILFGIPQDNPQATLPEKCRYDACIAITKDYQIDDLVCESELYGGDYVIFKIKHTAEDIQRAWAEMFPALHSMGYHIDNKPILEKYTGDMVNNDFCEICVPSELLST
ncbi:GyrI-like domain-containing protein [Brevibacillus ruminantium]|uniref:GyrI-like domain-containing protein n=1 Tax=Brevibacillus ruminantium TaxID=2950604 RepID=A0ABY4WGG3_9BACL|nr:GyrI-like domain-containing protein [Brevibacillus ruminantium]USG66123.1 GyrI-like domain-containing protein [Brevibacillus ruminantium]